jgi:malate permease and related proteins
VILVVFAIVAATAVGVASERRWGEGVQRLNGQVITALLWAILPFICFFTIARLEVDAGVGAGLGLAYVIAAVVGLLAWAAGRRMDLPAPALGALIVSCLLSNTGYLGIPLCTVLFGGDALGHAVAYDVLVNTPLFLTVGFAIGAGMGTRGGDTRRERLRAFLVRNPPLLAVAAGLLAPEALAPDALHDIAEILAFAVLPVGFFVVGVTLAAEAEEDALAFPPPLTKPVGVVLALRLVVAPALMLALSALIIDVPDAYLVEAAMPTGIAALVVGHAYGLDLRLTSAALAWTTAVAVVAATALGLLV